ncbi:MAG: hypothetical protein E7589_02440 [Ruminococcaceae bacterium]|nr:hypothetical protein [Oscillospiraceae bacterium]
MKKLIALALALILVVAMCACNPDHGDGTTDTTAAESESGTGKGDVTTDNGETGTGDVTTDDGKATTDDGEATTDDGEATTDDGAATTGDDGETTKDDDDGGDDVEMDYSKEKVFLGEDVVDADGNEVFGRYPKKLAPGESVATKFTVTEGCLAGIYVGCPSWNDNNGTLVLTLYSWVEGEGTSEKAILRDGYAKTVATEPVATETFENYNDNDELIIQFDDDELGEGGTYLVVLSNPDEEDLGVGYSASNYDAEAFLGSRTYRLPTAEELEAKGYTGFEQLYTSNDVVCFNSKGTPSLFDYMNLTVEVYVDVALIPDY